MTVLSQYVKSIAVFLIFISFLSIILPVESYKKYINLVMGLILILIIVAPLGRLFVDPSLGLGKMLTDMELELDRNIIDKERNYYEQARMDIVMETYEAGLLSQLENTVHNQGYRMLSGQIDIDDSDENFGYIKSIQMIVEKPEEVPVRNSLIRVERIEIGPQIQSIGMLEEIADASNDNQEDSEIKNLKNYLSDFYNLSVDNIYIIVREK